MQTVRVLVFPLDSVIFDLFSRIPHVCFSVVPHHLFMKSVCGFVFPDVSPSVSTASVTVGAGGLLLSLSTEQLACVALSGALLLALIVNVVICCRNRRKDGGSVCSPCVHTKRSTVPPSVHTQSGAECAWDPSVCILDLALSVLGTPVCAYSIWR